MEKTWVKIPDVLFFQEGPGVRNTQYTTEGVKLLNVANLVDGKVDLSTSDRYISEEEAYGKYKHFLCDDGDFIIASSGIKVEYIDKKMGFIDKTMLPLCMNTSTIRFKVLDENILRIRYFMYYLKSHHFKEQLFKQITGSAQLNYGPSHLKKMIMPLIDVANQDEIINCLDKIQNIIDARQQQLQKLDELVKARFVEMFASGGKEVTVEDVCLDIVDCPHSTPSYEGELTYPAIRTTDIKDGFIDWSQMKYVSFEEYTKRISRIRPIAGDIVYGREGTYGNATILPEGYSFCLGQRVMLFRPDTSICTSEYLLHCLISDDVRRQADAKNVGSTVPHVNVADAKRFTIKIHPIEKQIEFAEFAKKLNETKALAETAMIELQKTMSSLLKKIFG